MRAKQPLVSVIMNCHNGEKYLCDAIDSVYAQTYKNWEIIFWDNQSTDKSAELAKSYDDRVKYFYAPIHDVLYTARNYAIKEACGELYAFLDVDDWWDPEKLEKQIALFDNPKVGLVYGNYWFINEQKGKMSIAHKRHLPSGMILNELLKKYTVGLLTIVVRRKALETLDYPFNPRYNIIGDFDLVIRLSICWELECVQTPVAYYRWHGDNISSTQSETNLSEVNQWNVEANENYAISTQDGFKKRVDLYQYGKAINSIKNKRIKEALILLYKMPFGMEKIKLLIILTTPDFLLRSLRK